MDTETIELDDGLYTLVTKEDFKKIGYEVIRYAEGSTRGHPSGAVIYYYYGMEHRLNGPAVIGARGYLAYCKDGFYHREDGPARIFPKYQMIQCEYYYEGIRIIPRHYKNIPIGIIVKLRKIFAAQRKEQLNV